MADQPNPTSITEVIRKDGHSLMQLMGGVLEGTVHAVYTPLVVAPAYDGCIASLKSNLESGASARAFGRLMTQIPISAAGSVYAAKYADAHDKKWEFFAALAVTNLIGYLVHARHRARQG